MKLLLTWLIPGGVILGFCVALALGLGPENLTDKLGSSYPWVAFAVMALLGAFFHRSRVVLFVFGLGGLLLVFSQGALGQTGVFWVGGLLAATMGFLSLSQDRGVLSAGGLLQLFALLLVFLFGLFPNRSSWLSLWLFQLPFWRPSSARGLWKGESCGVS